MTKQGISRAALALSVGVSPRAIAKSIRSGLLTPALLPDNTLEPALARHLLTTGITGVRDDTPSDLTLARKRKTRASIRKLQAEILLLLSENMPIEFMRETARLDAEVIAVRLRRIPGEAAQGVVGLSPAAACEHVRTVLYVALTGLGDGWNAEPEPSTDETSDDETGGSLVGNSAVQLAANLIELQAMRLEVQSEIKSGVRVSVDAFVEAYDRRVGNCRQQMIALPSKNASMLAMARSEEEAKTLLTRDVEHAVAELELKA